jgi:START domain
VGKGDDRAIAIVSFSCPEASELKQTQPNHVRANLFVSMYLLRSVPSNHNPEIVEQCHLTRFLSLDLGGSVNKRFSNVVSSQQAAIPKVITDYLSQNEPSVDVRYRGVLTNEAVTSSVIQQFEQLSPRAPPPVPP